MANPRPRKQVEADIRQLCQVQLDRQPDKRQRLSKVLRPALVELAKPLGLIIVCVATIWAVSGTGTDGIHWDCKNDGWCTRTVENDPTRQLLLGLLVILGVGLGWAAFKARALVAVKSDVLSRFQGDVLAANPKLRAELIALPAKQPRSGGVLATVMIVGIIAYAILAYYLSNILA
jgi:hypothetical protein